MIDYKAFGNRIRKERKNSGKTQKSLADAIGVTPAFLGHLEHGRRTISVETLVALCNELRISPNYLFHGLVLDNETKQPLPPAFWEVGIAPPNAQPAPSAASAAVPPGRIAPPRSSPFGADSVKNAHASAFLNNAPPPIPSSSAAMRSWLAKNFAFCDPMVRAPARAETSPAYTMRSPAPVLPPAAMRESFSSQDYLGGRLSDEEQPQRKIVYLDEHLNPDQLAELHKLMSGWVSETPPHPSQPPVDLLCLIGPWGCAQLPFFSLDEDMPLLDPSSPDWTPEGEMQYLTEMLNQADDAPSNPHSVEDLTHMQRLTGSTFAPSEPTALQPQPSVEELHDALRQVMNADDSSQDE